MFTALIDHSVDGQDDGVSLVADVPIAVLPSRSSTWQSARLRLTPTHSPLLREVGRSTKAS